MKQAELSISHDTLTIKQEKAAIEQIRELGKVKEQYKAVQAQLKPLNLDLDVLKATSEEKNAIMDKLMAARQDVRDKRDAASGTHDTLKTGLDEIFQKVRAEQTTAPRAVARFFVTVGEYDAKVKRERQAKEAPVQSAPKAPAPTPV